MNEVKNKLLVILGPTASGKSDFAVECALRFNGEVISADSRQVYRGLDIATGKITEEEMRGIPHHLLDVADPQEQYSVALYKKDVDEIIEKIHSRNKLPILTGGTGFYIQAVVDNVILPEVPPNKELRKELQQKPVEELREILKELDPRREEDVTQDNPRRLIRAIEIAKELGHVPEVEQNERFNSLQIGLDPEEGKLRKKIRTRLKRRIEEGMIEEARVLHTQGLTFERMDTLGLEYRYLAMLLAENINFDEFVEQLENKIWQYARRQMRWFKRDKRITWFSPEQKQDLLNFTEEWLTH